MKLLSSLFQTAALLAGLQGAFAASSWSFNEATLTVQGKGSGIGSGLKEKSVASCTDHDNG